ncbi:MAG: ECF-type sigma factor, partial [Armatimonadota bacterium]
GLNRKLRDEQRYLQKICLPSAVRWTASELIRGQFLDLLDGLPISPRCREVARLRLDGYSIRETALILGITRQAVERHWAKLNSLLRPDIETAEQRMVPGRVPWYGWQEVFLEEVNRAAPARSSTAQTKTLRNQR